MASLFQMWVIYHSPSDYPGKYVVRRREIVLDARSLEQVDVEPTAVTDTLSEARAVVPNFIPGQGTRHCMPRDPADDPVIVEVWV